MKQVIYTAAHAVPASESIPLGGGAAIARRLTAEWTRTQPFPLEVLGPSILGNEAPSGRDIVTFSESAYARFCRAFEQATTEAILRHNPAGTIVLANDISEGPDFARLQRAGFRTAAIFHVDVVDYIASIYLRGWVRPETTVRWFARLRHLPMPQILKLIWQKQGDCVRYASHLIVPSAAMKATLERCYPEHAPGKVLVLPWGSEPSQTGTQSDIRGELNIPPGAKVLLTLSRISPEKGQHLLLQALLDWEHSSTPPQEPIHLVLCGEPAYMQGRKYAQKLHSLAARLRHIKVHFPGHVSGPRKAACFALADLYIFPSIHESYGLTLMEALSAGVPAICLPSHGASEVLRPECGAIVTPETLWPTIRDWLAGDNLRRNAAVSAAAYAASHTFANTAQQLARHIQ
ncbi:MAG: glycosyltransferase family 4 protein [Acidobacteria bacterium]|nr:glycosyltransferase family 4 protein [Acidobacteriota bacterium]